MKLNAREKGRGVRGTVGSCSRFPGFPEREGASGETVGFPDFPDFLEN